MLARFFVYGALGWLIEIVWTGLGSILRGDPRLVAQTYLWMFPIYGGGGLILEWLLGRVAGNHWVWRGLLAVGAIYVVEYTTGWTLRALVGRSPWDYSGTPFSVHGLIRFDYAPAWFVLALLFERVQPIVTRLTATASTMIK